MKQKHNTHIYLLRNVHYCLTWKVNIKEERKWNMANVYYLLSIFLFSLVLLTVPPPTCQAGVDVSDRTTLNIAEHLRADADANPRTRRMIVSVDRDEKVEVAAARASSIHSRNRRDVPPVGINSSVVSIDRPSGLMTFFKLL